MGSTSSREARSPLLFGIPPNDVAIQLPARYQTADEDGAVVCAVCINPLDRAATFTLPNCGHTFHALCLASALQSSMYCPLCRLPVQEHVCSTLAAQLLSDTSASHSGLAAELVVELRSKNHMRPEDVTAEETILAIRKASKVGDTSKIPAIATLLGYSKTSSGKPPQKPAVRLAAIEALRALVPAFPSSWPGLPPVVGLLRRVVSSPGDDDVRGCAACALKEVGQRGDEETLLALRCAFEDQNASPETRLAAADAVQALAIIGDICSMRTALAALADNDCSVRSTGLNTLKTICAPRGVCPEFLVDLAKLIAEHAEPEVRAAAVEVIAQAENIGGNYGIGVATALLRRDPSEDVAQAALAALRRLWKHADPDAVNVLIRVVAPGNAPARDPLLRCAALNDLAHFAGRGNAAALSAAACALDDEDGSVRLAAVQAMKQLTVRGDVEAATVLLSYTSHPDADVRRLVIEVLGYVASPKDAKVLSVLRRLEASEDADTQIAAQQALMQLR